MSLTHNSIQRVRITLALLGLSKLQLHCETQHFFPIVILYIRNNEEQV